MNARRLWTPAMALMPLLLAGMAQPAPAREIMYQDGEIAPPVKYMLTSPWQAVRRTCEATIKTEGEYSLRLEFDLAAAGDTVQLHMVPPLPANDWSQASELAVDIRCEQLPPGGVTFTNLAVYTDKGTVSLGPLALKTAGQWETVRLPIAKYPANAKVNVLTWFMDPKVWRAAGLERFAMYVDNVRLVVPDRGTEGLPLRTTYADFSRDQYKTWYVDPKENMTREAVPDQQGKPALKVTFVPRKGSTEHYGIYQIRGYGLVQDWGGYDALELDVWLSHVLAGANEVQSVPVNMRGARPYLPGFNVLAAGKWQHVRLPFPQAIGAGETAIDLDLVNADWAKEFDGRTVTMYLADMKLTRGGVKEQERPVEVPAPLPAIVEEPNAAEQEQGFQLFSRTWMQEVYLNSPMIPTDARDELRLFASPGEYEPVTLCLRALRDLPGAKVTVGELNGPGGSLPATVFETRVVDFLPSRVETNTYRQEPVLLHAGNTLPAIKAGQTRRFWLTAHVPEGAQPGVYSGAVTVEAGAVRRQMPLKLRVLPIKLARPAVAFQIYYQLDTRYAAIGYFYPQDYRRDFADMKAHGLNGCTITPAPGLEMKDGKLAVDWYKCCGAGLVSPVTFGELMDAYKQAGLTSPAPWGGAEGICDTRYTNLLAKLLNTEPYSPAWVEGFKTIAADLQATSRAKGWPEALFYAADEPANGEALVKECRKRLELMHRLPGVRTFVTTHTEGLNTATAFVDILDVNCIHAAQTNDDIIRKIRERKHELWVYNGCGCWEALSGRLFYGVHTWKTGATGATQWIYQCPGQSPNPFDQRYGREYFFTYPSAEGPIPTPAWESVREGIDDYRYALTLQQAITLAETSGRADSRAAMAKGKAALDQAPWAAYLATTHKDEDYSKWLEAATPGALDKWRWAMAEAIIELQEATNLAATAIACHRETIPAEPPPGARSTLTSGSGGSWAPVW